MVKNCTEQWKYSKRRCGQSYSPIFFKKSNIQPSKSCKCYLMNAGALKEEDTVKKDLARPIHKFKESIRNKKVTY